MNIRVRQIEGFLAIADTLSFSRAAEKIGMTQPAFSQMLRDLENTLGLKLIDRTTRRVNLTLSAQQLLAQMRQAISDLNGIRRNAQALARLEQGQLAIGVLPSLAGGVFVESLAQFSDLYPGVAIQVRENHNAHIIGQLTQHEVELAICTYNASAPTLSFEELFIDELVCVMREHHALARRKRIEWRRFSTQPVVLVSASSIINEIVRANLREFAEGKSAEYETLNMTTALNMARANLGVTLIPRVALPELNMKGLTYRPIGQPRPTRQVGIYRRAGQTLSPAAEKFRELLIERLQRPGHTGAHWPSSD
ncbi:LysR family transcriptional regulator [Candidimonas humi]|jgi:DNA-binding transcriptional LysR family regulator|uniref:LysR family transcriptional regulator n=1 Tax=Candidimonas humi TaxID=683355 RepID=A0ABV8NYB0_9BURK|nr:LysR family transcriptional regulator [Candidimonas humi]MBV6305624.1 LysR family transcriptional regulator [Candidimonas humi]